MIIAIDGPAGSGKSSTARYVASKLGFTFLDTGAMYRVVTLKALRLGVVYSDDAALGGIMESLDIAFVGDAASPKVFMDGEDVTAAIRSDEVTKNVSDYCARAVVRKALVERQRKIAASVGSVVCEGRDIGTVVFPNAELKIYMTATVAERARRRRKDFAAMGVEKSIEELVIEMESRDEKDSTRENSPLKRAVGAIELDSTGMTLEEQADFILNVVPKI